MTLGGVDYRLHEKCVVFSTVHQLGGFHGVHVSSTHLRERKGGESVVPADPSAQVVPLCVSERDLNVGGFIVDSGTTYVRPPNDLLTPWKEVTGRDCSNNLVMSTKEKQGQKQVTLAQVSEVRRINK